MDDVSANRAQQAALYGAPLGEVIGHCAGVLGLRQQEVAALLGLSAPMVSQLMSARRIKIANPVAAERLRMMVELVAQVDDGLLDVEEAMARMNEPTAPLTSTTRTGTRAAQTSDEVQALFRATASAADYLEAARRLDDDFPGIATLLRVYGTERADRAQEHTLHLLQG
ncbi:DNA-binding protein [Luteococcus sp.]|uniref:DNA-binding protein n=1 Tax=Luteococcus sp. TaxID=1969402 RepID=UPI003735EF41